MNTFGFAQFWLPAVRIIMGHELDAATCGILEWKEVNRAFEAKLGITDFSDFENRPHRLDSPLSSELKELLLKLAGPNGKFYLKVYQAQHGLLEGA